MSEIVFRAVGSAIACYGSAYLLVAILNPGLFMDWFAVDAAEKRGAKGWRLWVRMGLVVFGLGAFFYFASFGIFQVIPADWGSHDEDGNWEYARHTLQLVFAGYVTVMVVSKLEKQVEAIVDRDFLQCEVYAFEDALKFYGDDRTKRSAHENRRAKFVALQERSRSDHVRSICLAELKRIDRQLASKSKP